MGPGSYVHADFFREKHGYAPFSSTAERDLGGGGGRGKANPGPGSYSSLERKEDGWQRSKSDASSNAFVSKTIRFGGEAKISRKGVALSPGPGTYSEGNKWIKKTHKYTAAPTARRVTFQKVPTAPSVPARNQSNGYEEGSNGELLMQPAAEGVSPASRTTPLGPLATTPTSTLLATPGTPISERTAEQGPFSKCSRRRGRGSTTPPRTSEQVSPIRRRSRRPRTLHQRCLG